MKKKYIIAALVLTGCFFFAACGKNAGHSEAKTVASDRYYDAAEATADFASNRSVAGYAKSSESGMSSTTAEQTNVVSRKVIKTASLDVETRTFDSFIEKLNEKIAAYDAYIENASVSGNNIYSTSSRRANYTIRVPEDKLKGMLDSVSEFGTVITSSYNEDDITLAYVDVESRIKTLTTEQETLLGLLEKAAYLEDIIRLEERLSEVNYQLETYKSRQRTYDNKISYSTVYINVKEVQRITTVVEPEPQTLGQRIATGFKDNMENIKEGLENFIVWFLSYIVNIVLVCAIGGTGIYFCLRKKKPSAKAKKVSDNEHVTDETKMGDNK